MKVTNWVLALLVVLGALKAWAGPLPVSGVIQGGEVTANSGFVSGSDSSGSRFTANGIAAFYPKPGPCFYYPGCGPGTYSISDGFGFGSEVGFGPGGGSIEVDGVEYDCVYMCSGGFDVGYELTFPAAAPAQSSFTLTVPFTGDGGFAGGDAPGGGDFIEGYGHGAGTGTLAIQDVVTPSGPLYWVQSAQYIFTPIPEPTPFWPISLGLAVLSLVIFGRSLRLTMQR